MGSYHPAVGVAFHEMREAQKKAEVTRSPRFKKQIKNAQKRVDEAWDRLLEIEKKSDKTMNPELKKKWDQARKKFLKLINKHRKN